MTRRQRPSRTQIILGAILASVGWSALSAGCSSPEPPIEEDEGGKSEDETPAHERVELAPLALELSPNPPEPGEAVRAELWVVNRGQSDARGVEIRFEVDATEEVRRVDIVSGANVSVPFQFKAGEPGSYRIAATIDPLGLMLEGDSGDNLLEDELVVGRAPGSGVQLSAVGFERISSFGRRAIQFEVQNGGSSSSETPFILRADDKVLGIEVLPPIASDGVELIHVPISGDGFPNEVEIEFDPRKRLPGDPQRRWRHVFSTHVDLVAGKPSLHAFRHYPGNSRAVAVSFAIVNKGEWDAGPFRTRIFPGGVDPDGVAREAMIDHTGLAAGETLHVAHWIRPSPSSFDVEVRVDADDRVVEDDESNNTSKAPFQLEGQAGRWASIGPTAMKAIQGGSWGHPWKESTGRLTCAAVSPSDPDTLYVGSQRSGVWKSTNGGANWRCVWFDLPSLRIGGLAFDGTDPNVVLAATTDDGVYRTVNGGVSWRRVLPHDPGVGIRAHGTHFLRHPSQPILLVNTGAGVFRSSRASGVWSPWSKVLGGGLARTLVADPDSPDHVYATIDSATDSAVAGFYASYDAGEYWDKLEGCPGGKLPTSTAGVRNSIAVSGGRVYAVQFRTVGDQRIASFYRTTDIACKIGSKDEAYWEPVWSSPMPDEYGSIWAHPGNRDLVLVRGVDLWGTTDGGLNFTRVSDYSAAGSAHADHHVLTGTAARPATVYALGDGGIYVSRTEGNQGSWEPIGSGIANAEFYDLALAPSDDTRSIGGTQDNGTLRYEGTGLAWLSILGGDGATVDIDPLDPDVMYAMNQYSTSLKRSSNGGKQWTGAAGVAPNALPGPSSPPAGKNKGFNFPWQIHPDPAQRKTLLAAEITPGNRGLWRTTDSGKNWSAWFTPPGASHVICFAVDSTADIYYAGCDDGCIYASVGGTSWSQVFARPQKGRIVDLQLDRSDPTTLLALFNGVGSGRVFRLTRTSMSPLEMDSEDITSNLPAKALRTIEIGLAPYGRVFVGGDGGVFLGEYTPPAGHWAWRPYVFGLPRTADIRDLEVHPSTGVLRAVTYGRGAYEVLPFDPLSVVQVHTGLIDPKLFFDVADSARGKSSTFLIFGEPSDVILALHVDPSRGDPRRVEMLERLRAAVRRGTPVRLEYQLAGPHRGLIRSVEFP